MGVVVDRAARSTEKVFESPRAGSPIELEGALVDLCDRPLPNIALRTKQSVFASLRFLSVKHMIDNIGSVDSVSL